ncbi:MAG: YfiR family protein [Desulfobacteraceae bacterium]|nr:YfiR family protein [Desulfobacteraceae bacterium]
MTKKISTMIKLMVTSVLLFSFIPVGALSQEIGLKSEEYLLKAVFLERFTRFVEWPLEAGLERAETPFVIGIISHNPFDSILETVYADQPIKGKTVEIRYLETVEEINGCHMLFIPETDGEILEKILAAIRDYPVLTISDSTGYGRRGVHINMYVEKKQVRFEINHKAARQSGLTISYLLLKVAKLVESSSGV